MTATEPAGSPYVTPQPRKVVDWICRHCGTPVGHLGLYEDGYGFIQLPEHPVLLHGADTCVRCPGCAALVVVWRSRQKVV